MHEDRPASLARTVGAGARGGAGGVGAPRSRRTHRCVRHGCSGATSRRATRRWYCRSTPARAPTRGIEAGKCGSTARPASRCPGRGSPRSRTAIRGCSALATVAASPAPARPTLTVVVRRIVATADATPKGCGAAAPLRARRLWIADRRHGRAPALHGARQQWRARRSARVFDLSRRARPEAAVRVAVRRVRAGPLARARRGALQGDRAGAASAAEPPGAAQARRGRLRSSRRRHRARARAGGTAPHRPPIWRA